MCTSRYICIFMCISWWIYKAMGPHPEVVECEAGQSHTRDVLGELLQDLGLLGLRGEPGSHQDYTRITPGLHQDYTRSSTKITPGLHQV